MRFLKVLPLLLIPILFYQCQKEISNPAQGNNPVVVEPEPVSARLQGNILDENDQPAQNVTIRVGIQTAATDNRGYFSISSAALDKRSSVVTAEKTGYFKAYRTFAATNGANQVIIKMIRKTLAGSVDANGGGTVTLANGSKITLPANGVVKTSNNSAYSGTVNVYASYIDPTTPDIGQTVPGSFMADNKEGARVVLKSFGMLVVELESASAEKLQIKTGSLATVAAPIPASLISSAPANIPMWHVDEQTGIWKEEGSAVKQGNMYVGDVKHFSYWNFDSQLPSINITATIKTPTGQVVPYAYVTITVPGSIYSGAAHGFSDSLGQISGAVASNQNLLMTVYAYPCPTPIFVQNIGPFGQNTNLGNIIIPASSASVTTVTGQINNCSGASVANGFALLVVNNQVQYAPTDANGNFSTNMLLCSSANSLSVIGIDQLSQQQSALTQATLTVPATNLGTITACGTASNQFVNYTMDGVNYSYSGASSGDSLSMVTSQQPGSTIYYTTISCNKLSQPGANIYINCLQTTLATGTYPISAISIQQFLYNNTLLQPSNITLTSFPQTVGQFYEGSFTGQFKDAQNVTHTVTNGSFRVRKNF